MSRLPDFVIIGAMKSATSTLYEQLARQPGIFMCRPKEPNFFSDDAQYRRGEEWYRGLFAHSNAGDIIGEASTHYTKLPTHPATVVRMQRLLPKPRLIYVMRHPIDRLVSHYMHEATISNIRWSLEEAVRRMPQLIDYGRYSMQLAPYIETYGRNAVLPVFFDRLVHFPQQQFERVCRFIGYAGKPSWNMHLRPSNVSSERLRRLPLENVLIRSRLATWLRRAIVPRRLRDQVKNQLRITEKLDMSTELKRELEGQFDSDLAVIGTWLGKRLTCRDFRQTTAEADFDWG